MYSLRMSFWIVPDSRSGATPCSLGHQLVEQQQQRAGRVDGHRRRDVAERDPRHQQPHVLDRVDRHTGATDLAACQRVVGVEAELGGQVEGHRQTGLPALQQQPEAGVGLLGGGEAGVLAHRPGPLPVAVRAHAARVRVAAGVGAVGAVGVRVEGTHGDTGVGAPLLVCRHRVMLDMREPRLPRPPPSSTRASGEPVLPSLQRSRICVRGSVRENLPAAAAVSSGPRAKNSARCVK